MSPDQFFEGHISAHLSVVDALASDQELLRNWKEWVALGVDIYRRKGGKILFCGNGGSAADAQHIAAELSGRFQKDRSPLYAEALHVNSSFLTAVANDYGYERTFARAVEAFGTEGDLLVAMSTSGRSENILQAAKKAKSRGLRVLAMTGKAPNPLLELGELKIAVPSDHTARIQEMHMLLGHAFCDALESRIFS